MPRERVRYDDDGQPLPLRVTVDPSLAGHLYRLRESRDFADETELVKHIIREWLKQEGELGAHLKKTS